MTSTLAQRWPIAKDGRKCFVCAHSSTNSDLLANPEWAWRFHRRARENETIVCLRFNPGVLVYGYNTCGEWADR